MDWPDDDVAPYKTLLFLHRPLAGATAADIEAAQERIARDELTAYYLIMRYRQSQRADQVALALPRSQQLGRTLLDNLGFELTGAQRRVVTEVLNNLAQTTPMLRLVQGDVGSGKTVVAAFAATRAAEHQAQTALMAPTEILAEQHYLSFSKWLTPLGIPVVVLTSGLKRKERQARLQALADGEALVAVGTHALFQNDVAFKNLALTIVDEQHRFGVHQRMALRAKGANPAPVGDDGDAHTPHPDHGPVRRHGCLHHRRTARRASAHRDPADQRRPTRRGARPHRPRTGRGAGRLTGCAHSSRTPTNLRPSPPRQLGRPCGRGCPASASG